MPLSSNHGRRDVSLAALIRETVRLGDHSSGLRGRCPAHPDPSRSLYVSTVLDRFHCFGCGAGGDAARWIMIRDGIDRDAAEARLVRWKSGGRSGSG